MLHHGPLMTSPDARLVSTDALDNSGFRGWWAPTDRMLGGIQVNDHLVISANTVPWDGAPFGRLNTIVSNTLARQRGRVADFLKCYNPLLPVVGEILHPPNGDSVALPHVHGSENLPFVLLSRYRDNLYIVLANIACEILPTVRFCVAALLRSVYGIALKWEHHDSVVVWGEGAISCPYGANRFSLLRKGASRPRLTPYRANTSNGSIHPALMQTMCGVPNSVLCSRNACGMGCVARRCA